MSKGKIFAKEYEDFLIKGSEEAWRGKDIPGCKGAGILCGPRVHGSEA